MPRSVRKRLAFGGEVDLLAPIHLALGQFPTDTVVAAKVRTLHHFDGHLLCFRQRKEVARHSDDLAHQLWIDAVIDEIEETQIVGYLK